MIIFTNMIVLSGGTFQQSIFHNVWILNARLNAKTLGQVGNSVVSCKNIVSIESWLSMCTFKEVETFGYHIYFRKVYVACPFKCFMYFLLELLSWNACNV